MGVARWLEALGRDITGDGIDVDIANAGQGISVTTPVSITPEIVRLEHFHGPMPRWILTAKNGPAPAGVSVIDYEAERQHNSDYYDRIKRLQKEGKSVRNLPGDERKDLEERAPR